MTEFNISEKKAAKVVGVVVVEDTKDEDKDEANYQAKAETKAGTCIEINPPSAGEQSNSILRNAKK